MYRLLLNKNSRKLSKEETQKDNLLLESFENPASAFNNFISSLLMVLFMAMAFFGVLNIVIDMVALQMQVRVLFFTAISGAFISNYFLSHRRGKYIRYFEEMKNISKFRRIKHAISSAIVVLAIFAFTALSIRIAG